MPTEQSDGTGTGGAAHRRAGLLRLILQPGIARPAMKVSLVVGTLLNVINNGEQLWAGHGVSVWRVALNFVVPFSVSSYSAARNEARRLDRDAAP